MPLPHDLCTVLEMIFVDGENWIINVIYNLDRIKFTTHYSLSRSGILKKKNFNAFLNFIFVTHSIYFSPKYV